MVQLTLPRHCSQNQPLPITFRQLSLIITYLQLYPAANDYPIFLQSSNNKPLIEKSLLNRNIRLRRLLPKEETVINDLVYPVSKLIITYHIFDTKAQAHRNCMTFIISPIQEYSLRLVNRINSWVKHPRIPEKMSVNPLILPFISHCCTIDFEV